MGSTLEDITDTERSRLPMGELLDAVVSCLEEENWELRPLTGRSALEVDFAGKHAYRD